MFATAITLSVRLPEALGAYLRSESWQVQDIKAGIAEADAGEFATVQEVDAVFAKYSSSTV